MAEEKSSAQQEHDLLPPTPEKQKAKRKGSLTLPAEKKKKDQNADKKATSLKRRTCRPRGPESLTKLVSTSSIQFELVSHRLCS